MYNISHEDLSKVVSPILPFLPPLPADLVPRPASWAKLDSTSSCPLILVVAPGGYGKTTTIASWLCLKQSTGGDSQAVVWHNISPLENNLHFFCSSLISEITEVTAGDRAEFAWGFVRTRQLLSGQEKLTPEHLAILFAEDADALPVRIQLVLDDYHDIDDASVHAFVQSLLRRMPANLQLLILTRKKLPFSVARLRSQNRLAELSIQELQLSSNEAGKLLAQMLEEPLAPDVLAAVHKDTEGWAAGIRLIGLALRDRLDPSRLVELLQRKRSIRYISDYLMDEVLAQQPDDVQGFLLQTSLLLNLDEALCAAVMGDEDGARSRLLLDYVVNNSLFVVPVIPSAPSLTEVAYRYHTLFRSMLQDRLRARYKPSEIAAMHRRIARRLTQEGNIDLALQFWLLGEDSGQAVALLEAQVPILMDNEAWQTLERYFSYLPDSMLDEIPQVVLAKCVISSVDGDLPSMRRRIDQLSGLLAAGKPAADEEQANLLQAGLAVAQIWYKQYVGPLATLEDAALLEAITASLPVDGYIGSRAIVTLSWVYSTNGEEEKSRAVVNRVLNSIGLRPTLSVLRLLRGHLMTLRAMGRVSEGVSKTQEYYDLAAQMKHPVHSIWADIACGLAAYIQNDDERAWAHARSVLDMHHITPIVPFAFALSQAVIVADDDTQFQWLQAQIIAARQNARAFGKENFVRICDSVEARLWVRMGKIAPALQWARATLNPDFPLMPQYPAVQICWLHCMLQSPEPADLLRARELAEKLVAVYKQTRQPMLWIETGLLLTLIYQAEGNRQAALDLLAELLQVAGSIGYLRPFTDKDMPIQGLLEPLLHNPELEPLITPLLGASPTVAARTNGGVARLPAVQLTKREQEILELLAKGMTIQEIAKATWTSPNTVRNHIVSIYNKLGVNRRQAAVNRAYQLGLCSPDSSTAN